jgi:hypothetical protein
MPLSTPDLVRKEGWQAVATRHVEHAIDPSFGDHSDLGHCDRRKSAANPSGASWKLPHDSTRPSGSTIGLSIADASSLSATKRQCVSVSRAARHRDHPLVEVSVEVE